jgi:hypothetical protein
MREIVEFRVPADNAKYLRPNEGVWLGDTVIKVQVPTSDPRYQELCQLERQLALHDEYLFLGWNIHRKYTRREMDSAEAILIQPKRVFEPAGEECGTDYDESSGCPLCRAGAAQVSELRLDLRKAPKNSDIAKTIAGETIISQRFAELISDTRMKGFEFGRVRHKARYEDDPIDLSKIPTGREILRRAKAAGAPHPTGRFWVWLNRAENQAQSEHARREYAAMRRSKSRKRGRPAPVWYQLFATSSVDLVPPTRTGIDPCDDDSRGEHLCPRGDTIGLNLLSEIALSRQQFIENDCDIAHTNQFIGVRRGVLRPERMYVVSSRLWRSLVENNIKGFRFEVAHLK